MQIVGYHADEGLADWVNRAEATQARLVAAGAFQAPGAPDVTARLRREFIYHSARMQGNTLTPDAVAAVLSRAPLPPRPAPPPGGESNSLFLSRDALEQARAVAGTEAEIQEIRNLDLGVGYIEMVAAGEMPLTERLVRVLHALVMLGLPTGDDESGSYRTDDLAGLTYPVPPAVDVVAAMGDYGRWLALKPALPEYLPSPILRATYAHTRLLTIHPFLNGNGRTARLLLNLLLRRAGFPLIALDSAQYQAYLTGLREASASGDATLILGMVLDAVDRALGAYA